MNPVMAPINDVKVEQDKTSFDYATWLRVARTEGVWVRDQIRRGEADRLRSNLADFDIGFIDLSRHLSRQSISSFWIGFFAIANQRSDFSSWEESGSMVSSQLQVDEIRLSEPSLSQEFRARVSRFLSLQAGWDGFGSLPIAEATAGWASEIARQMLHVAGEPRISPASTGELLMVWKFDDGTEIEVFVDKEQSVPSVAVLARDDDVYEVPLEQLSDLTSLLKHRRPSQASTW